MYALVDCNNFYVACERLFRPDLMGRPVVVLSNNDGCVVSRSPEVRALGVKVGEPVHRIKHLIRQHGIVCFSSNYALYGDISQRVMSTLESLAPQVELYSIDEAFVDLSGMSNQGSLFEIGQRMRQQVYQWTGIATCVGVAPTKTLAKLANHAAKQYPPTGGVVDLTEPKRQRRLMALTPVREVWGIGRKLGERLNGLGIETAVQLADADARWIRRHFSVVVERTVLELNGQSCAGMVEDIPARQQILCSRSFGDAVTDLVGMREAITSFVSRGAEKLRQQNQKAKQLSVFIRSCPYRDGAQFYSNSLSTELLEPTSDTRQLAQAAHSALKRIWRDGRAYKKAGIMLSELYGAGMWQTDMFSPNGETEKSEALMQTIDRINQKGLGRIFLAAQGTQPSWHMKREHLSPAYTTDWKALPIVR